MESRNSWFLLCLLIQWHSDLLLQGQVSSNLCLSCALCLSTAEESTGTAVLTAELSWTLLSCTASKMGTCSYLCDGLSTKYRPSAGLALGEGTG